MQLVENLSAGAEREDFATESAHQPTEQFEEDSQSSSSRYQVDVLQQLKANVSQLEDLQLRMSYMLKEVRGLVQRS